MAGRDLISLRPRAETASVFSSAMFCRIWASVFNMEWHSVGPDHDLGCLYTQFTPLKFKSYSLSPVGLYWGSDIDESELQRTFAEIVLKLCRRWDCLRLTWSFRYDVREQLNFMLFQLGESNCRITEFSTHVIPIKGKDYDEIHAH